jgi:ribosomal-protein-alanine N-acetyltransferase
MTNSTDRTGSAGLGHGVGIRLLDSRHAVPLTEAYRRNRGHLAPWEPRRSDAFFTVPHQQDPIRAKREMFSLGTEVPWVLVEDDEGHGEERVIGTITLTGIVRGPLLSANPGYWVDREHVGRGIGSAAVRFVAGYAAQELGLHRIQAATLPGNAASRKVLARAGFTEIGMAPEYLEIAGAWQDHLLHQVILPPA